MPEVPSTPETERDLVKCIDSVSSALRSSGDSGDQPPATDPAIIPAIAAAGPKTEFELDLALRLALSGVFLWCLGTRFQDLSYS